MSRAAWWAIPIVAAVGVLLGARFSLGVALVLTVTLSMFVAQVVWWRMRRRIQHAAERVNRWIGRNEHEPIALRGAPHWDQLTVAINALGAAYARRGARLTLERPWRRELVDSMIGPAALFSADGRLAAANHEARELLGIGADDDLTVIQALGSAALAGAVREVRRAKRPVRVEAQVGDRDLEAVASLVGDEALVMVTDRTEQRRVEELRRNFVVNASHELKTPATAIQALADALDVVVEKDPARARELVARLSGESERLIRMVHDMLDLRRLEERGATAVEALDLAETVRSCVAELTDQAEQRNVSIEVTVPDEPARIVAEPDDVRLIVANLVANAIQYNKAGGRVSVRVERGDGAYALVVADTGIGIPRNDLPRIFERFYRVDVARSRETGGTGLGLSIVRHAVERNHGRVEVESLLGEGTTFTVTLPIARD